MSPTDDGGEKSVWGIRLNGYADQAIRLGQYIDECIQLNLLQAAGPQSLPAGNYYLLQDTLYRAVGLTNSSGDIVEAYDTDAYGNTLIFTAPDTSGNWWGDAAVQSSYGANDIIYCGYSYNPETENYYVRNRYYSPVLGRWISRDPIGIAGGINLYGYVAGRAANRQDPGGEQAVPPVTYVITPAVINAEIGIQVANVARACNFCAEFEPCPAPAGTSWFPKKRNHYFNLKWYGVIPHAFSGDYDLWCQTDKAGDILTQFAYFDPKAKHTPVKFGWWQCGVS